MSKVAKAWVASLIAIAGVGLAFVYPPAGVALAFVGTVVTVFSAYTLNVLASRLAVIVASVANGYAIYLGSGSLLLASIPSVSMVTTLYQDTILAANRTLQDFMPIIGLALIAGLGAASWPVGWWGLAVAPNLIIHLLLVQLALKARSYATAQLGKTSAQEGTELADFELPGRDGNESFQLSEHRGGFVLLCFVRGDWCPVCHVMLRIINKEQATLKKHGVKLVLITPSQGQTDAEYAERLGIEGGMHLDEDSTVAKSLGLLDDGQREGKDVPLPVTILVDGDGIVRNLSRPDDVTAFSSERRIIRILEASSA